MNAAQALDNVTQFPAMEVPRKGDDNGNPSAVPASLFIKLFAIMEEMDGVPRSGTHKQGWSFMPADAIFNGARAAFLKHRVLVIPGVLPNSVLQIEGDKSSAGTTSIRSLCVFTYTFIDVDTGQSYMTTWPGESQDYSDKGVQQSGTSSMKYVLMKMFLATPDHDPDYNTGEPDKKKKETTTTPAGGTKVETPLSGAPTQQRVLGRSSGTPVGGKKAPSDVMVKLMKIPAIMDAWQNATEAQNTINKMWGEQAIHADMSDKEIADAVVARLQSPTHGKRKDEPEGELA